MIGRTWVSGVCAVVLLVVVAPARATFHEWRINEVYSNASGTVQFIEFLQPSFTIDDERFVGGLPLTSNSLTYNFSGNLPSAPPANSHFLVATPGYLSLLSAPAPDYVLPVNNFFSTSGDTINYAFGTDVLSFTSGQLPTNGSQSLNRASWGSATLVTAAATPTNFAGVTGSVPEPACIALLGAGLLIMRSRRRGREHVE